MLITYFYHLVRIFFHSDQVEMIFTATVSCSPGSTTWRRHFHPPAFSTTGISCRTKKTNARPTLIPGALQLESLGILSRVLRLALAGANHNVTKDKVPIMTSCQREGGEDFQISAAASPAKV